MSDYISLIEHALGCDGNGILFQFTDICAALHSAQYIIRICPGISVITFHHIGERILLRLLLHGKFTAVNDTCGMYVLTVFIINLQRCMIMFRLHNQIEFLRVEISLYGTAPLHIRDFQQFRKEIDRRRNPFTYKLLLHHFFQFLRIFRIGKHSLFQLLQAFLAIIYFPGNPVHICNQDRPGFLNFILFLCGESLQPLNRLRLLLLIRRLSYLFCLCTLHRLIIQFFQIPQIIHQKTNLLLQLLFAFPLLADFPFQFLYPASGLLQKSIGMRRFYIYTNRQNLILQIPELLPHFFQKSAVRLHRLTFHPDLFFQILHVQAHGIPIGNFQQNIIDKDTSVLLFYLIIPSKNFLQCALLPPGTIQYMLQLTQCLYILPQRSHIHPLF